MSSISTSGFGVVGLLGYHCSHKKINNMARAASLFCLRSWCRGSRVAVALCEVVCLARCAI